MEDNFTHRVLVIFNRRNCDLSDLLDRGKLHSGNAMEFVSMMNSAEYAALGLEGRVTRFMAAGGASSVRADEALASDAESPVPTVQEKVIRSLRADARLPEWERAVLVERALGVEEISVPAMSFLLFLYSYWHEPIFGATDEQVSFMAIDQGFGLSDFCRP